MGLVFNAAALTRIKPSGMPLPLAPVKKERLSDHPIVRLMQFARQVGLGEIPAETLKMLREHPHFRYVFYQVFRQEYPYPRDGYFREYGEARAVELLKDPSLLTDEDLYHGIAVYINNFSCYLPGGMYRSNSWMDSADRVLVRPIVKAVDRALRQLGKSNQEMTALHRQRITELNKHPTCYVKRLAHAKIALAAFNIMVDEYGYDPARLWR